MAEETKRLTLEEMESVAGGFDIEKLSAEDREIYDSIMAENARIRQEFYKGEISEEEYHAYLINYGDLMQELSQKYDR